MTGKPRARRAFGARFARALRAGDSAHALALVEAHAQRAGGCWLWPGATGRTGYGVLHTPGYTFRAHRLVFELARGDVPPEAVVHHRCAVRACVNPDHLEVVRHVDNLAEMRARHAYLAELSVLRDLLDRLRSAYRPSDPGASVWGEVDNALAASWDLSDEDDPLLSRE